MIGGGSSALDLAGLLHQAGVDVQLVSRRKELKFHTKPNGKAALLVATDAASAIGAGSGITVTFLRECPLGFSLFA